MSITLREATADDAEILTELCLEVQELHIAALPHLFKPIPANSPDMIQFYQDCFAEGYIAYIAEVDGEVAGFVFGEFTRRDETLFTYARSRFHIDQMGVKEAYRKRGVGKALMEKVIAMAREANVKNVTLSVWAFNAGAIAFYEATGFENAYQLMSVELNDE